MNFFAVHVYLQLLYLFSYRLRKAIMNLSQASSLSQQVEWNFLDFRQAVDIHNRAILLVNLNINIALLYLFVLIVFCFTF